jgi:hypothetical protein
MPTKEFEGFTRLDASDVNAYLANRPLQNAIINGAFDINQRNFSSSTATTTFGFDRWQLLTGGGATYSSQAFTPGIASTLGHEAANHARIVTSGQSGSSVSAILLQRIEDVRTFANEEVTVSFWAKAGSGTPNISVELGQNFGTGGSPSAAVTSIVKKINLDASTSWKRYSATLTLPSIAGKTIGTDSNTSNIPVAFWVSAGTDNNSRTDSLGIQSNTFDIWGVQLEAGTVVNDFRRNANSIGGELASCQRYYQRINQTDNESLFAYGTQASTTSARLIMHLTTTLRVPPTAVVLSNCRVGDQASYNSAATLTTFSRSTADALTLEVGFSASGAQHRSAFLQGVQDPPFNSFVEIIAEL